MTQMILKTKMTKKVLLNLKSKIMEVQFKNQRDHCQKRRQKLDQV